MANLISEDISQMGVKAWGGRSSASSGNANYIISRISQVYMDTTGTNAALHDSSSFLLFRANNPNNNIAFDSLVFRKADINENGEFLGVREISWAVNENGELHRRCRTIFNSSNFPLPEECPEGPMNEAPAVFIAKDVKKFSFNASAPGLKPGTSGMSTISDGIIFPLNDDHTFKLLAHATNNNSATIIEPQNFLDGDGPNTTVAELKLFAKNNPGNSNQNDKFDELYFANSSSPQCLSFEILNGETYVVEFEMPFFENSGAPSEEAQKDSSSTQFQPGRDHIAVGLRYSSSGIIDDVVSSDVLLYAPQHEDAARHPRYAEFSVRGNPAEEVCVALTFAFYSPLAYKGKLRFTNFKIYRKQTGAYHFVSKDNNYDEDFAKSYVDENNDVNKLKHKKLVKAFELLLEIDKNGEVAGTYSKDSTGMAIPVPNNGVTYR